MRCHLREGIYRTCGFCPLHQSSAIPAENARVTDGKVDSEGENYGRRSACATRDKTVSEALFMPYPGMRPLSSPAVVKALLLPLHCICGLFRLYPRQPVLPALSLVETACRNRRRDTNFSGYGGPFRKIHRTFVHRTNNNRITVKRTWLKLKSKIQK